MNENESPIPSTFELLNVSSESCPRVDRRRPIRRRR